MEEYKKIIADFYFRAHLDPKLPAILETYASRLKGMGYVLMQLHKDERYKLIEAGSRWLTPAEQNYGMTSLELSAVNWAVEKCKPYLLGLPYFEIVTDHQALVSMLNTTRWSKQKIPGNKIKRKNRRKDSASRSNGKYG